MGFLQDYEPVEDRLRCPDCRELFTRSKFGPPPARCPRCQRIRHNERTKLRNRERRGHAGKPKRIQCRDCGSRVTVPPGPGGIPSFCAACRDRRRRRQLAVAYRRHHLKKLYGLTPDERVALAESQRYVCAICGQRRPLVVDHDHATTEIRGLLCSNCNTALGLMADNPALLRAAAAYLEEARRAVV